MKKGIRFLSFVLIIALLINTFPVKAIVTAEGVAQSDIINTTIGTGDDQEELVQDEQREAVVIGEDESLRDEATKHYILSNGNRKAVKYSYPVHYKKDGKWVDIDNSLEYNVTTNEYINKSNSFKTRFNKNLNSEELFIIENNGYTMSWKYQTDYTRKSTVAGKPKTGKFKNANDLEKYTEKVNSKITYENFEAKSTLEYVVTPTGVKENIILESADCKNEFTFQVDADGLALIKHEDGSISAISKETAEEIFYIPAPFMYDANGENSYDVEYRIVQKKSTYVLTLTADETWLQSEDRVYPVTIDPVVHTNKKKHIVSKFVSSWQPNAVQNTTDIYVGFETSEYGACRSLFQLELPTLNKGDMVTNACLVLYLHNNSFYAGTTPDKQINAHMITEPWDSATVTWNDNVQYNPTIADYNYIKRSDPNNYEFFPKQFDVTRMVKEWYEGTAENYGILIKGDVESGSYSQIAARSCFWSANYNSQTQLYPYIAIEYRNNKGLEDMWSYSSYGIDSAGMARINDYTGNLVYEMPLLSGAGNIMPLSLSAVYNNYCAGQKLTVGKNNSSRTTPGKGFRLNVQETVLPSTQYGLTGDSAATYPYVYADGDGTEHYFKKVTEDGQTVYKDEDGLGLTLEVGGECTYRIKDKGDNYKHFNAKGNLCKILDAYGNNIHIYFKAADSANGLEAKSRISYITDGSGNRFTFTYYISGGVETDYIKTITDSAGRTVTLTTSSGLIRTVTYPDSTKTKFVYTEENAETDTVEEAKEGLINYITANDGYILNFDYTSKALGRRVRQVKEFGANPGDTSTKGQWVTFDRTQYNTTIIRTSGTDGVNYVEDAAKGEDDIVTTLQFDNAGRTISQQLCYGSGVSIGAGAYRYTSTSDDASVLGSKNKLSSGVSLGKNIANLLTGGNGEDAGLWSGSISDTVTGTRAAVTTARYMGKKSLQVKNTALSGNGVNYFRQGTTNVTAGGTYTLSAYVKTVSLADVDGITPSAKLKGVYLKISAHDSAGTELHKAYSEVIDEVTDTAVNNGFRRLSATIETPADTTQIKVYLCLRDMTGIAYFDCIQASNNGAANTYNMLENSSFEKVTSGLPTNWTVKNIEYTTNSSNTVTQGVSTATRKKGKKSMRIVGDAALQKHIYQRVPVEGKSTDTYIVSGWAKASPVSSNYHLKQTAGAGTTTTTDDKYEPIALFELCPEVKYTKTDADNVTTTVYQKKPAAKFNTSITGWQYTATSFSLAYTGGETGCTYTPEMVTVIVRYYHQVNTAYFDHLMLCKEPAPTYTYDKEGNAVSVAANGEQTTNSKYDANNDLTSYTDTLGNKTTMTYNDYHQLILAKSPRGVYTANGYNDNGTYRASELRNKEYTSTSTLVIRTNQAYHTDDTDTNVDESAFVKSVYDEHGVKAATYTYDYATGAVKTVTDAAGTVTTNTYNNNYTRLLSVAKGNGKVTYNYGTNSGRLSSIVFGNGGKNETYRFSYDVFGNMLQTKVGSVALCTNTYAARNNGLSLTTYGNGDTIQYTYNKLGLLGQVTRINNGNQQVFKWGYAADGTPITHRDIANNRRYHYQYDSLNRLVRQEIRTQDDAKNIGFVEQGYDLRNNVTKQIVQLGGRTIKQAYSYSAYSKNDADGNPIANSSASYAKDNLPTLYQISSTRYATYRYDSINRLNKRALSTIRPIYNNYVYKLSQRNDASSTDTEDLYRTNQLLRELVDNTAYQYTYDALGNITAITKGVRTNTDTDDTAAGGFTAYRSYGYDSLGQLTRENNATNNKTNVFAYDELGNITSKTEYDYTTGDLGSINKTILYGYSNDGKQGWNNLLTSVDLNGDGVVGDGETITYDEIGNPTTYLGNTLAWDGRHLTNYNNIAYSYDADGIRASKTIGTARTEYFYVGDKLVYQAVTNTATGDVTYEMYFFYDSYNHLTAIRYVAGATDHYYYVTTNMQGDVLGIYTAAGVLLASYEYDAWGNCTVTTHNANYTIGDLNPIRYRGYYYDTETGFYYCNSRYYDPEIGRFINADGYVSTGQGILGNNMFAYCGNNPVNRADPKGTFWKELWNKFTQTLQQASGYLAVAAGVSQVDTPVPGPADIASGILLLGVVVVCAGIATYTTITAPAPTISIPKVEEKDEVIPAPPPSNGTTYYHVTTPDNAAAIMATGVMTGSKWESGYVYAWKTNPSKYAIENLGAHMGVTISFKTSASFVMDTGITDPKVQMYGPVVSTVPGPIVVWDVQIVG